MVVRPILQRVSVCKAIPISHVGDGSRIRIGSENHHFVSTEFQGADVVESSFHFEAIAIQGKSPTLKGQSFLNEKIHGGSKPSIGAMDLEIFISVIVNGVRAGITNVFHGAARF